MNLFDVFKKSKKGSAETASLGKLWACVVKFAPWDKNWYDVVMVETDVMEMYVRDGKTFVQSSKQNPFNKYLSVKLYGPVGRIEYVSPPGHWIGFFEKKKDAEDAYRLFAAALVQRIESASSGLGISGGQ